MKIILLAVGKVRGAELEMCAEYSKRLKVMPSVKEIATANQKAENEALLKAMPEDAFVTLCDETGKDLSSRELAVKLSEWQQRAATLVFIIGGADGVTDAVRDRCDYMLSLGRKTWPHKLARIMLLEQLYRAQQINAGHPYHRD